jgi:hypothetical protein
MMHEDTTRLLLFVIGPSENDNTIRISLQAIHILTS